MSKKDEALKLALDALDCIYSPLHVREINKVGAAMSAIREALAEQPAQQEPVAVYVGETWCGSVVRLYGDLPLETPLYTSPQPSKPWVGLTDEEIDLFINGRGDEGDEEYVEPTGDGFGLTDADLMQLVRRSEAKLKEKNA